MSKVLFVGFKGKNNASGRLAELISPNHLLLTNSFGGLKKDIDTISEKYDLAIMFLYIIGFELKSPVKMLRNVRYYCVCIGFMEFCRGNCRTKALKQPI